MVSKKMQNVLDRQIETITPDADTLARIARIAKEWSREIQERLRKKRIMVDVFVGGSVAKNTVVRNTVYDVDIFVRFPSTKKNVADLLEHGLTKHVFSRKSDFSRVHGSRDYFRKAFENITLEVIPVSRISKPEDATNSTDLSYFHVQYVHTALAKKKGLADEIKLAKAFTDAQRVYGAESYIQGFSGYALELLVIHYGGFIPFLKAMSKIDEQCVLDPGRLYRSKQDILHTMNVAKLQSPVVLVDPTFKERNALASLSHETFKTFQKAVREFLEKPDNSFFMKEDIAQTFKKRKDVFVIKISSKKQSGDIAGTKLKKLYRVFVRESKRFFRVPHVGFTYSPRDNIAYIYVVARMNMKHVVRGPLVIMKDHAMRFRAAYKKVIVKKGRLYAEHAIDMSFPQFVKRFMQKEKTLLSNVGVQSMGLVTG